MSYFEPSNNPIIHSNWKIGTIPSKFPNVLWCTGCWIIQQYANIPSVFFPVFIIRQRLVFRFGAAEKCSLIDINN